MSSVIEATPPRIRGVSRLSLASAIVLATFGAIAIPNAVSAMRGPKKTNSTVRTPESLKLAKYRRLVDLLEKEFLRSRYFSVRRKESGDQHLAALLEQMLTKYKDWAQQTNGMKDGFDSALALDDIAVRERRLSDFHATGNYPEPELYRTKSNLKATSLAAGPIIAAVAAVWSDPIGIAIGTGITVVPITVSKLLNRARKNEIRNLLAELDETVPPELLSKTETSHKDVDTGTPAK